MSLFKRQRSAVVYDKQTVVEETTDVEALDAAQALTAELEERRRTGGRIGDVFLGTGKLSSEQLTEILTMQSDSGKRIGALLVDAGLVSEGEVAGAIAAQLGLSVANLRDEAPDPAAVLELPESAARSLRSLPMGFIGEDLVVAVEDPLAPGLIESLVRSTHRQVQLRVAAPGELRTALNTSYRTGSAIDELVSELATTAAAVAPRADRTLEHENAVSDAPIVRIVNLILTQAIRDRASDIHIEPAPDGVRIRNRIDGTLHEDKVLPLELAPAIVSHIKARASMNIIERRTPQDGQIKFTLDDAALDLRVSTTPVMNGEKVVLRILDKSRSTLSLGDLGMPPELHKRFTELSHAPAGMVVCAGPTGSGKTTTLYATLNAVDSTGVNVMTVEDPVEYVVDTINQIQINEAAGVTFASGLRSILRQDPDVILVGEIRDIETASIAVQAALTGHFVLSSVHATDAVSALHRFIDMGIEPFRITSSVLAVVGQRLVRRICTHCKVTYVPDEAEIALYEKMGGTPKTEFYRGAGCNLCASTGYAERIGVYEVLTLTDEIRALVAVSASVDELRKVAIEQGMSPIKQEALRLVEEDVTTLKEIARTVYPL